MTTKKSYLNDLHDEWVAHIPVICSFINGAYTQLHTSSSTVRSRSNMKMGHLGSSVSADHYPVPLHIFDGTYCTALPMFGQVNRARGARSYFADLAHKLLLSINGHSSYQLVCLLQNYCFGRLANL